MRPPSLFDALLPLGVLAGLIAGSLALFGLAALDGPIQVALVLCCAVAAPAGLPFALFNIFSPALSVVYGFTGFRVLKTQSDEEAGVEP